MGGCVIVTCIWHKGGMHFEVNCLLYDFYEWNDAEEDAVHNFIRAEPIPIRTLPLVHYSLLKGFKLDQCMLFISKMRRFANYKAYLAQKHILPYVYHFRYISSLIWILVLKIKTHSYVDTSYLLN